MHLQPAFRQPRSNGMHDLLRLRLTAAVDHRIIGITRKRTLREVSLHPCVKRIVHEQIHQHRADHAMDAKDNFEFERQISLCRSDSVLDLRHKK
jgi:hypothetical protein